jgi:suppressor of ftsI
MNIRGFLACAFVSVSAVSVTAAQPQRTVLTSAPLAAIPEVRSVNHIASLTLFANKAPDGNAGMEYDGARVPPLIRVWPGDRMRITYINHLPVHSTEKCALGPCMDMTNLHFHGMQVSPLAPQDDVLTMLAAPGQTLHYDVVVPPAHPPGLFWYHTHPHGESAEQDLDGMSGAIIVEGIDRYVPQVRGLRERVLVIRTMDITPHFPNLEQTRSFMDVPAKDCGTSGEKVEGFATVNGSLRPSIVIAPRERQFWRIVNAQPEVYVDLKLDGEPLQIVALDGEPLARRNPAQPTMDVDHLLVPPAGRVEAIVTGPPAGAHATLRTLCVNTGPAGDVNAAMVLADIVPKSASPEPMQSVPVSTQPATYPSNDHVTAAEETVPQFVVRFTEDKHGFYINGQKFKMTSKPMITVRIGGYQHWRIVNDTKEWHPFHIHQVHFLTFNQSGAPVYNPVWLDTVNVPEHATVDTVLDFTNPVIRGMAVFHCHILSHEDKGMMAKILFKG